MGIVEDAISPSTCNRKARMTIDWQSLDFSYRDCKCHIRYIWKDGKWNDGALCEDPYLRIHIAATALHYGQSAFEGLKAFHCRDGRVRVFRADENAKRLETTATRIRMPVIPADMFTSAVHRVVRENLDYVPPYGTGGALYIRPLLFGSGPRIGVRPADEYTFLILVMPVGNYYKGGLTPVSAIVVDGFDRAAPQGVGNVKVAGNYAADLKPNEMARSQGYPINLYLDAREHRYIDEFGTSNFIAITRDNTYVTPSSPSVLPSITNKTLMTLAKDSGLKVEQRPIAFDELSSFAEIGACGTAVIITPVNRIVRNNDIVAVGPDTGCGPVLERLYNAVRGIQVGDVPDVHGWNRTVN